MSFSFDDLSPVIVGVLALLILFSIVSWTIMLQKSWQIRRVGRSMRVFTDDFWEARDPGEFSQNLERYKHCPLVPLFRQGYQETLHFVDQPHPLAIENIGRTLRKASAQQIDRLEKDTSFLATTASTTPFIGLFGTVRGVLNAFESIGEAGSTSLAIVAPGISEALFTTAVGLAVAIPAVIGYNALQSKIRRLVGEIDAFTYDFLNMVQKQFKTTPKGD